MRKLQLDIFDYSNHLICPLYDSGTDISGQAFNVHKKTERNGWKELSFSIPSMCDGEDGQEENFRLQYLVNEYRIRLVDDYETDWFIISEPKVTHNAFAKTTDVVAGHISQLLKYKNTDLEFSDEEGNNVGTALALLETIIEGTGWHVGNVKKFTEKDGETVKIRTLNATGENGGAFGLVSDMCDLFDAKAVYHGEGTYTEDGVIKTGKVIDILPLNPFSEDLVDGQVPMEVKLGASMLEIHYDKNMRGVTRTLNSDAMVTVLNTYGAYGDKDTGLGTIQGAKYNEYTFTVPNYSGTRPKEYKFTEIYGATYYFPCTADVGDELVWSDFDFTSRMYVLNVTKSTANSVVIYKTYSEQQTTGPIAELFTDTTNHTTLPQQKDNQFTFLTNFTYYRQIGLLTDEMLEELAKFQRDMPELYEDLIDAANDESEAQTALSELAYHGNGFLRLDVSGYNKDTLDAEGNTLDNNAGYLQLAINKTDEYPDGVIYRSDYLEKETKYFSWHAAKSLKPNGMAIPTTASWLMIIHEGANASDPPTWQAFYVRNIDQKTHLQDQLDGSQQIVYSDYTYAKDEDRPDTLTLFADWDDYDADPLNPDPNKIIPHFDAEKDKFYLFCTNSMLGSMGVLLSQEESVLENLETQTKVVTEYHPTIFEDYRKRVNNLPAVAYTNVGAGYGWCCSYDYTGGSNEKLFFSYPENGDTGWHNVYAQDAQPTFEAGAYFYNTKLKTLYHGEQVEDENQNVVNTWVLWDTVVHERLARDFGVVLSQCLSRKEAYMGLAEKYVYEHDSNTPLPVGNYAIESPYGYYWVFTTDQTFADGESLWVDTSKGQVYQGASENDIVSMQVKPYETVTYPKTNEAENLVLKQGDISLSTGKDVDSDSKYCTEYLSVFGGTKYSFGGMLDTLDANDTANMWVLFYDSKKAYYGSKSIGQSGYGQTAYINMTLLSQVTITSSHITASDAGYIRIVADSPDINLAVSVYDQSSFFTSDGKIAKQYHILSPIAATGTVKGLNNLTGVFSELSDHLYMEYIPVKVAAQDEIKSRRNELSELLGDMWKESKRSDDSYVDGDQDRLYDDSMDDLKDLGKPDATYDIDFLDLYGTNKDEEFYADSATDNVEWPDIHETDAVHLIDPEIDINLWAYIDSLDKCYDKRWETKIEVNTHLTLMAQHNFTDVLSNVANVASTVKAKQQIYDRAKNIGIDGSVSTSALEGTIDAYRHEIMGGQSGWHTNEKGQMVFESTDGNSAMMLTGSGLCIANSKDPYGEWNWRTAITGNGIVADAVTTGYLSADRIWAGSITTNQISSEVGHALDISSNMALNLFATTDGSKPAGELKTTDSAIRIKAASGATPASIDVASGGAVNIVGSDITMTAVTSNSTTKGNIIMNGGNISVTGGSVSISSTGSLTFSGSGTLDIHSGITGINDNTSDGVYFGNSGLYIRGTDTNSGKTSYIKATNEGTLEMNGGVFTTGLWTFKDFGMFKQKYTDTTTNTEWPSFLLCTSNASDAAITEATDDDVFRTVISSYTSPGATPPSGFNFKTYQEYVIEVGRNAPDKIGVFAFARDRWFVSRNSFHDVAVFAPRTDSLKDGKTAIDESSLGRLGNSWTRGYIDTVTSYRTLTDSLYVESTFDGPFGRAQQVTDVTDDETTSYLEYTIPSNSSHIIVLGGTDVSRCWIGFVVCTTAGVVSVEAIHAGSNFPSNITIGTSTNELSFTFSTTQWANGVPAAVTDIRIHGDFITEVTS